MEIRPTVFDGLEAVEVCSGPWRLVLVTSCGPRIAFLGRREGGGNLLYWDRDAVARGGWRLHGGHRVWVTRPMADESEDTYAEDNLPCTVETKENRVTATAPAHPFTKLVRGIRVEGAEDGFKVTGFLRNEGDMLFSGGVWAPTCVNPEDTVFRIPLGEPEASWDIVKVLIPLVFAGNRSPLDDPQVRFSGSELVVTPRGGVCKRCAAAPQGRVILDCGREKLRFTKRVPWRRDARYPLDGCNVAVFVGKDNWMGELETYGPEQTIRPGESVFHEEEWILSELT